MPSRSSTISGDRSIDLSRFSASQKFSWAVTRLQFLDYFDQEELDITKRGRRLTADSSMAKHPDLEAPLKLLVETLQWDYAVIWKLQDNRSLVWHQGWFNNRGTEAGQNLEVLFESIFKQCYFTQYSRSGYAYLSWQQQSPLWWTRLMDPVPTDLQKEKFLLQAGIETIVCFPGHAADGTAYCVELASSSPIPQSDDFQSGIQEFLNISVAPHISLTSSPSATSLSGAVQMKDSKASSSTLRPSWSSGQGSPAAMEVVAAGSEVPVSAPVNLRAEASELAGDSAPILRPQEPYFPWTAPGSGYFTSGLAQSFGSIQDENPDSFGFLDLETLIYQNLASGTDLPPGHWNSHQPLQSGPGGISAGGRKGKEIVDEFQTLPLLNPQSQFPKETKLDSSPLTQYALDSPEQIRSLLRTADLETKGTPGSLVYNQLQSRRHVEYLSGSSLQSSPSMKRSLEVSPRSPWSQQSSESPFQRPSRLPITRLGRLPRQALIYRWTKELAPKIEEAMKRGRHLEVGGKADIMSPKSAAHIEEMAEIHKIAERVRRSKFNSRLQTLISLVPIIKKKDKVSVLTSTIEYIHRLNSRIATLENIESSQSLNRPTTLDQGAASMRVPAAPMDRISIPLAARPTLEGGASSLSAPVVVVQESTAGGDKVLEISVEANNHPQSLIRLLNILQDLGLELVTLDYGSRNHRFYANVSVNTKNSRSQKLSFGEVQEVLQRLFETPNSSPSPGSN